jgi:hypothetical protein
MQMGALGANTGIGINAIRSENEGEGNVESIPGEIKQLLFHDEKRTIALGGGVGSIFLKRLIDYYSTQNEVFVPKCLPRVACIPNTAQNRNKLSLTPEIELRLSDLGTGYIVTAVDDDDNSEYDDNIKLEYLDCILSIQNNTVGPNESNKSVGELTWMEPPGTEISMTIFKTNEGFKQNGTHTITQLPKELDFFSGDIQKVTSSYQNVYHALHAFQTLLKIDISYL